MFRPQQQQLRLILSLPPSASCVFHSSHRALPPPPPFPPPPPLCPCWIGGVNTGREQALFHHAGQRWGRGWAFLRSSCAGVKSLLWFSFHLSSANGGATLTRLNSDPCKEFPSKDGPTPVSQLPPPNPQTSSPSLPLLPPTPYDSLFLSFKQPVSRVDRVEVEKEIPDDETRGETEEGVDCLKSLLLFEKIKIKKIERIHGENAHKMMIVSTTE